jgi:hypothetical protein
VCDLKPYSCFGAADEQLLAVKLVTTWKTAVGPLDGGRLLLYPFQFEDCFRRATWLVFGASAMLKQYDVVMEQRELEAFLEVRGFYVYQPCSALV